MWTCAHCEEQVEGRLEACPTCGARRQRALHFLAGAFTVLGYVGLGWLLVYIVLGIGEVEGWYDALWFGVILTVIVGVCLGTFAAGRALRVATQMAADLRAQAGLRPQADLRA